MSFVEKESTSAVGLEGVGLDPVSGDSSSALKVTRGGAVATVNGGRASTKPVLYREPRTPTPGEIRNYIASRSDDLQKFVAPLEEALRKASKLRARSFASTKRASVKVAELVLGVVRRIAHRETGVYSIEPNIALLLSALYAGTLEGAIVSGLVRRAQGVLDADAGEAAEIAGHGFGGVSGAIGDYDVNRELDELSMLLKWYVKRKMSLTGLEVHQSRRMDAVTDLLPTSSGEDDAIFGFEVMHDHQVFATKGCYISCGVRLVGHDGQPLWLRVSARWNGQPVAVRPEWSTWTDPSGPGAEGASFCSLVPIRPQAQRLIIDDIRAFVPYAALDLPPGRCDIELHIAVIDEDGRELLAAGKAESICIPQRELLAVSVPSPHSIGMWPHDVVSGDRISGLAVHCGHKLAGGWERHTVSVNFDLALFMHAGESLLLECRFLDSRGSGVELSSLGIPYEAGELDGPVESVSSYRYRRMLQPKGAWASYRGLCIDIPVEFLLLEAGTHNLTCEVLVVSQDDRVLCGDIGLVSVHVPGATPREGGEGGADRVADESFIEVGSIEVEPNATFDGAEGVRIEAIFWPRNAGRQIAELASGRAGELFRPYRVEVSIEREDGHLLLQAFSDQLGMGFKPVTRGVCVEGRSAFGSHSVVTNFRREEILGWSFGAEGHRGISKARLFARVRALSMGGEELLSTSREFFMKLSPDMQPQVVEGAVALPRIVDVVATITPRSSRISGRMVVNVPRGRESDPGTFVACVLQSQGKRVGEAFRKPLVSPRRSTWSRQQSGLCQVDYEFELDAGASGAEGTTIIASIVGPSHEVLHSVRQEARSASLLLDPHGGEGRDAGDDDLNGDAPGHEAQAERRGIFSWFKS